jgi:hypothetical protein
MLARAIELGVVRTEALGKVGTIPIIDGARKAVDIGLGIDRSETVDGDGRAVRLSTGVDDLEDSREGEARAEPNTRSDRR